MPILRVIGAGRAGLSLEAALRHAGWMVLPTLHHDDHGVPAAASGCDLLVLAAARLAGRTLPAGLGAPAGPSVLHEKAALRKALDGGRSAGLTVGLVPTMGALHDGHAALIRRAVTECDVVAVTVFVNPLQFDRPADLAAYPRTRDDDVAAAAAAGATLVFAPTPAEMYGSGCDQGGPARVHLGGLADRLEGAARPGHFDGVATVCAKLFGVAGPCRAY
ncbi:MAG: pantoate--beta-alanine ligase, partial [Acidimicrobiales bacterium]